MTDQELIDLIKTHRWYHEIELRPGVFTGPASNFGHIWSLIEEGMSGVDFNGRGVLDIGCRDGKFSVKAKQLGASGVIGIDNDLSDGMVNLVIPILAPDIQTKEINLYDLDMNESFDIVMMFGVLYHLRYPFLGLKIAIDALNHGGKLLIETATYVGVGSDLPFLYCPWPNSPYESGSCSFFTVRALSDTLLSMGVTVDKVTPEIGGDIKGVKRVFYECTKSGKMQKHLGEYWEGIHSAHSSESYQKWNERVK